MAGPCSDPCGTRLWLGAPGHILARERSRLRCPNIDRIRRRFRSSSPGCRCSGTIRGVGGQRVFLPSVPSALRPSSAWCSVEQNQPHPMAGPCSDPCGARLWLERPAIYLQGKDPVYGAQMLIVYAVVSVLPTPAVGSAGPYAVLAGSACSFPMFRLPCALYLLGVPWSRTSRILWQGLVSLHAEPAYGLERPTIYLQGKDPVYGAQMLIVYAVVSVLPASAVGTAGPYAVLAGSACSFPLFRLPCALHLLGVPYKPAP